MAAKLARINTQTASGTSGVWTTAAWSNNAVDLGGFHYTTGSNTDKIYAPETSFYLLWAQNVINGQTATNRGIRFTKNGSSSGMNFGWTKSGSQAINGVQAVDIVQLNQGEYCGAEFYQNSGSPETSNVDLMIVKLPNLAGCRASASGTSPGSPPVWTTEALDSETFDTRGWHSNVTNNTRITVDYSGLAIIVAQGSVGTSGGVHRVRVLKNGSQYGGYIQGIPGNVLGYGQSMVTVASVQPGDYFELDVYQSIAGANSGTLAVVQLPAVAALCCTNSTGINCGHATNTQLTEDTEQLDLNGVHTVGGGSFTAQSAGYHVFFGSVGLFCNNGSVSAKISKASVTQIDVRTNGDASNNIFTLAGYAMDMAVSDTAQVYMEQNSGSAQNSDTNSQFVGFYADFDSLLPPGPYSQHIAHAGQVSW